MDSPRPAAAPPLQQELAEAFEHAGIGMALVGLDDRFLRVNPALREMLGYAPGAPFAETLREIFLPEDATEEERLRGRMLGGEMRTWQRERRYRHCDGGLRWGQFTSTLMRGADGNPACFIFQAQDIDERKRAEQALRESEERFRSVGRLSLAWFWEQDTQLRFTAIAAQEQATHFEGHDVAGLLRWELPDVTPLSSSWEEHRRVLDARQPFANFTYVRRLASGASSYVAVSGEPVFGDDGRFRGYRGTAREITSAVQAAEQVRTLAQQLTATLESITDAFFTVDRQWCLTYVNSQAERIMRRPREQLLGCELWTAFPNLVGTAAHGHYLRALQGQVPVQFEEYYPQVNLWLHVRAYPSAQGLAVYAHDMSERVRAQNEILRLNAELEERVRQRTEALQAANRDLESFSYSIAHDLRAPLSSIDGFSRMLEQNAGQPIDGRNLHFVARIRNAVRHMGELTEGLLALARLSRTTLHREPVDLAVLARVAIELCEQQSPGRRVEIAIAPSLPAEGDPRLLSQVMGNLVANAWKFTSRTSAARIEVGSEHFEGQAHYFVRDNGAGFDMAYAGKLFEAFHRLHPASEFEGTGIGLAIVHRIVDRHGGRIWAEAAPGQGACFRFTLPGRRSAQP